MKMAVPKDGGLTILSVALPNFARDIAKKCKIQVVNHRQINAKNDDYLTKNRATILDTQCGCAIMTLCITKLIATQLACRRNRGTMDGG